MEITETIPNSAIPNSELAATPPADPETDRQTDPCLSLATCVQALGVNQIQRHLFLCADQTKPKCCDKDLSIQAFNYLKQRLQDLGIDRPTQANTPEQPSPCVFRTKANCLRICQQGPILVIYPDGIWYHSATPAVIEQIIQSHLLNNQPLQDYVFLVHPLSNSSDPQFF